MLLPQLGGYADLALLFLRLLLAVLFGSSGWSHVRDPESRGESVGLSPTATLALGGVEVASALLLAVGLWDQAAATALVVVMLGAVHRKIFVWETGFWGEDATGWFYELLYVACLLVVLTTGGGTIGID